MCTFEEGTNILTLALVGMCFMCLGQGTIASLLFRQTEL